MNFSYKERSSFWDKLATTQWDLLIIGGGITGAGIALDAALRGWKVALVEKQDFAAGTSSRSTKLIHGGLRYLKQFEFKLVHETGTERAIIHHLAPHLVQPEDMLLPIVEGGVLGKMGTRLGLWVYDKLAGVKEEEAFEMLSDKDTLNAEPLLRKEGLIGGALYTEYRTDDARLTLSIIKTAVAKGAVCLNYAEVSDFVYENAQITGFQVMDICTGKKHIAKAKVIVNAAGPWVDTLREKDKSLEGKRLHLTKGIHIVIRYDRLPLRQSVYFDVADGRMIFAVPRIDKLYIGTTDTNYTGEKESPNVTKEDINYLLKAVNHTFPQAELTENDIESSWAGLRPLIHEEGKSPSELSRKDEIFESDSGLISIAGGKLTGYRKMAERIVDLVGKKLEEKNVIPFTPDCKTDKELLIGSDFGDMPIAVFMGKLYAKYGKLTPSMKFIAYLSHLYGTESPQILDMALAWKEKGVANEEAMLAGELQFCVEKEMTIKMADFLIRRTGKLYFDRPNIEVILPIVQKYMQLFTSCDALEMEKQRADWAVLYENAKKWE